MTPPQETPTEADMHEAVALAKELIVRAAFRCGHYIETGEIECDVCGAGPEDDCGVEHARKIELAALVPKLVAMLEAEIVAEGERVDALAREIEALRNDLGIAQALAEARSTSKDKERLRQIAEIIDELDPVLDGQSTHSIFRRESVAVSGASLKIVYELATGKTEG